MKLGCIMINRKSTIWIQFAVALFFSCILNCKDADLSKSEKLDIAYLNENCVSCHAIQSINPGIAPTFVDIKQVYQTGNKEDFIKNIIDYTSGPDAAMSKNKEWIQKYGVMPLIIFSTERLSKSLEYLYSKDLGSERWKKRAEVFLKDPSLGRKLLEQDMTPTERGQLAAMKTKSVLGSNLMMAIKEKGIAGAVEFCNHSRNVGFV